MDKVIPYTDVFLYDIKAIDEDVHRKCTGYSNKTILKNIKYLHFLGKTIEVRIPYVPEYNANQIKKIGEFLKPYKNIKAVKVLPYYNYAALGLENTLPSIMPTEEEIAKAEDMVALPILKINTF